METVTNLVRGSIFGAALTLSGVYLPSVIVGQLVLRDFHMLQAFLTASATSAAAIDERSVTLCIIFSSQLKMIYRCLTETNLAGDSTCSELRNGLPKAGRLISKISPSLV